LVLSWILNLSRPHRNTGIIVLSLMGMIFLILNNHISWLIALVVGGFAVVIFYRWPIVGVLLALLLSTQVLKLVYLDNLPYIQIMSGLRFNSLDIILLSLTIVSCYRLIRRRERPDFLKQIIILIGLTFISVVFGILMGTTNLDIGLGGVRILFSYSFYLVLVEVMKTPKRIRIVVGILFSIALTAVTIQFWELLSGQRLNFGYTHSNYYGQFVSLDIQSEQAAYLWNRAVEYLFLVLFLSLGSVFEGRHLRLFLPASIAALAAFAAMLVRQWQIYIIVGVVAMLFILFLAGRIRAILGTIVAFMVLGISIYISIPFFSPITIWLNRMQTVSDPFQQSTFLIRLELFKKGIEYFQAAPIFGYGLSPKFNELFNSDLGFINTLLLFGIVGIVAVIILIRSVFLRSYYFWKHMPPSLERGWMLGIIGLWVAIVFGYLFATDFFTRAAGIWMVAVVMALTDSVGNMSLDRQGHKYNAA
jgi:O-antigen ligase